MNATACGNFRLLSDTLSHPPYPSPDGSGCRYDVDEAEIGWTA